MSAKLCDACGKQIVFGKDRDTDKWIALDNSVPLYRVVKGPEVEKAEGTRILVPHAYICPARARVAELYQPPPDFHDVQSHDVQSHDVQADKVQAKS